MAYDAPEFKDIKELLDVRSATHRNNVAIYQKNRNKMFEAITYGQLKQDVDALGTALLAMGLKGKKIALIGENSYHWVVSYLATICGTGIVVPLDKQLADHEIKNCLNRVDIDTVIYSNHFEDRLKNLSNELNVNNYINMENGPLNIDELIARGKRLVAAGDREFIDVPIDNNALASLLFTSGTTSASKIVMLSHKNMMANVKAGQMMVKVDESDVFMSVLPLNHTLECTCVLLFPLACGSAVAYGEGILNLAREMKEIKPTVMMIVPRVAETFYDKIASGIEKQNKVKQVKIAMALTNLLGKRGMSLKRKVFKEIHSQFGGNLRLIMMGGAPVNPAISKYLRNLGILAIQGYGLTECAPLVTLNSDIRFKDDSAGMKMPGSDVIIAKPDADGIGEIAVKGPQVMLGYYEDEEATRETIRDGYLYTGDLGKFDSDGFLKISGRSKNVIVSSNGKNIFPEEIETLLNANEYVKESIVYQDSNNNSREKLTAEVVVADAVKERINEHPEFMEEIKKILHDYLNEVNKKLSDYKRVHNLKIRLIDFEKTTTLKIKRFAFQHGTH